MSDEIKFPSLDALLTASIHLENIAGDLEFSAQSGDVPDADDVAALQKDAELCLEVQRWLDALRLAEEEKLR